MAGTRRNAPWRPGGRRDRGGSVAKLPARSSPHDSAVFPGVCHVRSRHFDRSAIRDGVPGSFFDVVDFVSRLETETRAGRQRGIADHLTRLDFVVLDELGYMICHRASPTRAIFFGWPLDPVIDKPSVPFADRVLIQAENSVLSFVPLIAKC